jgi:MFS family permease
MRREAENQPLAGAEIRRRPQLDPLTLLCYGAMGTFGFLTNGLGPVVPLLQRELSVGRGQIGTFSLFLAFGLLVIGLSGHSLVTFVGRRVAFWGGVLVVSLGALTLLAAHSLIVVGAGVALTGAGGAMLIFLVPAILADRHGHLATRAIVQMTGVVSTTAILAPLLISLSVTLGVGWRVGYLALPLAASATLALVGWRVQFRGEHLVPAFGATRAAAPPRWSYRRRWLDVLIVVSVEMCMVFWSADYLVSVLTVDAATAAAIVSLFLIGMAVGRFAGGQIARSSSLFLTGLMVAAIGFAIFWFAWLPAIAGVGLLVTGLGVALLYPLSISRAIAAWPSDPDRASARGALAVGLAFGIAPFALAQIADWTGPRPAFLLVPLLLAIVIVNTLAPHVRDAGPPSALTASEP